MTGSIMSPAYVRQDNRKSDATILSVTLVVNYAPRCVIYTPRGAICDISSADTNTLKLLTTKFYERL